MRNPLFIVLLLLLAAGCTDRREQQKIDLAQKDSLFNRFSPLIRGVWVPSEYIRELERSKSPIKAYEELEGINLMIIDPKKVKGDSLTVASSLNNHEGYEFELYFRSGKEKNRLASNVADHTGENGFYELGYVLQKRGAALVLYHYDKNNKLIDKKSFEKIRDRQPVHDDAYGLQYMVNKKLFAGEYTLTEADNRVVNVTLTPEGKITGLKDYKTYEAMTDFAVRIENNLDAICFRSGDKNSECLAFKLADNELLLYETAQEEAGPDLVLGALKYRLVRNK